MTHDAAGADRAHAVRSAARGWRKAGAIDEPALRAIEAAYPDDRARLGFALRALVGIATFFGGLALTWMVGAIIEPSTPRRWAIVAGLVAVLFAGATELQLGRLRRRQAGAEFATALLAAIFAGLAVAAADRFRSFTLGLAALAVAHLLAAWRWGYATLAAIGAGFALLAVTHHGSWRIVWLAAGVPGAWMVLRPARSPKWPPSRRRCFEAAGAVLAIGAYLAANLYALDHRWLDFVPRETLAPSPTWRAAAIVGTTLIPALVLALGVRFRDRTLLVLGAVFAATSFATLRFYVSLAPVWVVLTLSGGACCALAIALRRWLDGGPAKERHGFTAEPLYEHRRLGDAMAAAATIAAMSPAAREAQARSFEGGGGLSGGGGATGGA